MSGEERLKKSNGPLARLGVSMDTRNVGQSMEERRELRCVGSRGKIWALGRHEHQEAQVQTQGPRGKQRGSHLVKDSKAVRGNEDRKRSREPAQKICVVQAIGERREKTACELHDQEVGGLERSVDGCHDALEIYRDAGATSCKMGRERERKRIEWRRFHVKRGDRKELLGIGPLPLDGAALHWLVASDS